MGMPASAKRWTADEARQLQDEDRAWPRYEVIDGELLVTPSARPVHQLCVGELYFRLRTYVAATGVGVAMTSPADVELEPDTVVQPDVFVISNRRVIRAWREIERLILAIEVLSPGTERADREKKPRFYARTGVAEYWIVDAERRHVERWRPHDERPEVLDRQLVWHPAGAADPLPIDLEALFAYVFGEEPLAGA